MDETRSGAGIGCCKARMPNGVQQVVGVKLDDNTTATGGCKVAFLTAQSYSSLNVYNAENLHAKRYSTVELGWLIHTTNLSLIGSLDCKNMTEYREKVFTDYTTRCVCDYNTDLRLVIQLFYDHNNQIKTYWIIIV